MKQIFKFLKLSIPLILLIVGTQSCLDQRFDNKSVEITETPSTINVIIDPTNGDIIITPITPNENKYSEGTEIIIIDNNGNEIIKTIDKDGNVIIPNDELSDNPEKKDIKIKEKDKAPSEEIDIIIPGKSDINQKTENPKSIEIIKNNDGSVTFKPIKEDGKTYPAGTLIDIFDANGNPLKGKDGNNINGITNADGVILISKTELPENETKGAKGTIKEKGKLPSGLIDVNGDIPGQNGGDDNKNQTVSPADYIVIPMTDGTVVVIPVDKNGDRITPQNGERDILIIDGKKYELKPDGSAVIPTEDLPDGPNKKEKAQKQDEGKDPSDPIDIIIPGQPKNGNTPDPNDININRDSNQNLVIEPIKEGGKYEKGTMIYITDKDGKPIKGQDGKFMGPLFLDKDGKVTVPKGKTPTDRIEGAKFTVQEPNKKPANPINKEIPGQNGNDNPANRGDITFDEPILNPDSTNNNSIIIKGKVEGAKAGTEVTFEVPNTNPKEKYRATTDANGNFQLDIPTTKDPRKLNAKTNLKPETFEVDVKGQVELDFFEGEKGGKTAFTIDSINVEIPQRSDLKNSIFAKNLFYKDYNNKYISWDTTDGDEVSLTKSDGNEIPYDRNAKSGQIEVTRPAQNNPDIVYTMFATDNTGKKFPSIVKSIKITAIDDYSDVVIEHLYIRDNEPLFIQTGGNLRTLLPDSLYSALEYVETRYKPGEGVKIELYDTYNDINLGDNSRASAIYETEPVQTEEQKIRVIIKQHNMTSNKYLVNVQFSGVAIPKDNMGKYAKIFIKKPEVIIWNKGVYKIENIPSSTKALSFAGINSIGNPSETRVYVYLPDSLPPSITDLYRTFADISDPSLHIRGPEKWDVGNVTTIRDIFTGSKSFPIVIPWRFQKLKDMRGAYAFAKNVDPEIGHWFDKQRAGILETTAFAFREAHLFHENLAPWYLVMGDIPRYQPGTTISSVAGMFYNAKNYGWSLSSWHLKNVLRSEALQNNFDGYMLKGARRSLEELRSNHPKFKGEFPE